MPAGAKIARARHREVKSGPRPGGIPYIVNQQSHQALYRRAVLRAWSLARYTNRMTADPIRLFVSHAWAENDDYARVFEYLEASGKFYYINTSQPQGKQPIDRESQREELRRQIAPCEVLVVLPAVYQLAPELVLFQMNFAKAADRPIVAMENFGSTAPLPKPIKDLADEVSAWNERSLIDALRRQARHQESTRWDTIEFKLD
jgi:hypothetical protein